MPTIEELTAQLEQANANLKAEQEKNAKLVNDNANLNKYNGDLKAKYQSKLTDEEKVKQEREEELARYKETETELKTYKLRANIGKSIADENMANEIASLFANGDTIGGISKINEYIAIQKDGYEKKMQEISLAKNPTPPPKNGNDGKSWKDYTMAELNELQEKNPQEYKKILNSIK